MKRLTKTCLQVEKMKDSFRAEMKYPAFEKRLIVSDFSHSQAETERPTFRIFL